MLETARLRASFSGRFTQRNFPFSDFANREQAGSALVQAQGHDDVARQLIDLIRGRDRTRAVAKALQDLANGGDLRIR
jgi:hypothetical protein